MHGNVPSWFPESDDIDRGGTVLKDSLRHTYHGDHAYVFYQKPANARKYPLVFAHGVNNLPETDERPEIYEWT